MQGPLNLQDWLMWKQALLISFPTTHPSRLHQKLGPWNSITKWDWFWHNGDARLFQKVQAAWRVWLPAQRMQYMGAKFSPTSLYLHNLPDHTQHAIVCAQGQLVTFRGAQELVITQPPTWGDFHHFTQSHSTAQWALVQVKTPDNGKGIAQAVHMGEAIAVSNGSFKDKVGSAGWTINTPTSSTWIKGCTTIPGQPNDQCAYWSELGSIFSTVTMVNLLCKYYTILTSKIQFRCNGLDPLCQCFECWTKPSPLTLHFDLIKAICQALSLSPLTWWWQHICGHQHNMVSFNKLDTWAQLNIDMDKLAKQWHHHLTNQAHIAVSKPIPGEGWALWVNDAKLSSLSQDTFDK